MSGVDSKSPGTGLEGHLRNLILSNAAPDPGRSDFAAGHRATGSLAGQSSLQQPSPSIPLGPGSDVQAGDDVANSSSPVEPPAKGASQHSKGGRKRPNQAQRRQLKSQYSIPIDTRPQPPPGPRPNFSPARHFVRPAQQYQRHMHSHSQPLSMPQDNSGSQAHYVQGPWRGPQSHNPHPSAYSPHFQNHQRNVSLMQEPGSPQTGRAGVGSLYNYRRQHQFRPEDIVAQSSLLDELCYRVVSNSQIERSEIAEKEAFRQQIEAISREAIVRYAQEHDQHDGIPPKSIELKCFGSLSSGFATKASDMDLGLLSPLSQPRPDEPGSPIPRLLEKAFLDAGLGARLLSRTRVPIIKLCENPPEKLRLDLLAERHKFDSGLENEAQDIHDDDDDDQHIASHSQEDDHGDVTVPQGGTPSTETDFIIPEQDGGEPQRFHLRQGPKQSISSYYSIAKRILRKASGRDITVSNYRDFTARDWEILNRVRDAFVQGIYDANLRQRLTKYPSLTLNPSHNLCISRSLHGVFTQIEGEHLVMQWEKRQIRERGSAQEFQAEHAIKAWEDVQCKPNFDADPVLYTKELQLALDKLKKLYTVQLVSLEQGQHETPAQYLTRTKNIIFHLRPPGADFTAEQQSAVVAQYVSGINQEDIRTAVREAIASSLIQLDLNGVGRRHKSLHLARELEKALTKELYDAADIEDVKDYIALLRSPLRRTSSSGLAPSFVVPLTRASYELVNRIKRLPDPHIMPPNQPRDRYRDRLEFPKTGAGVQCDINFSAHLALHNTLLLRCYSHTDPRVQPMVLFVKNWAKIRGINSGYRGTLSSYGYVMMVLHYLINVVQPFVCPNLQQLAPPMSSEVSAVEFEQSVMCRGYNVRFWRQEDAIIQLARANQLNHNNETVGQLLRGFFEYFAQSGTLSNSAMRGFDWGRDVISIRTIGGLMTKQEKGWTGAKTVYEVQSGGTRPGPPPTQATTSQPVAEQVSTDAAPRLKSDSGINKNVNLKEVRYRYLFAIEDPFELEHNVARTVTHNGIVSIRDEFRRAWRIIRSPGAEGTTEDLLKDVNDAEENAAPFLRLLDDIHGPEIFPDE